MTAFPATPIALLTGHTAPVHAVTYSAGAASYILTGSADRSIRLYNPSKAPLGAAQNTTSPGLVNTYSSHGYEVLSLCINSENNKFVSTGGDKIVFLWDVITAQTIQRFSGHSARVNRGVFGGESDSVIVSGSFDGSVRIWDCRSKAHKPIMILDEARDSVTDVVTFDGLIVSGSVDGRVRSYDLRKGMCDVDVMGYPVTSLEVSQKGDELLVSCLDSTVRLMDRENGQSLKAYRDDMFVNTELRVGSTLGLNDSVVISGSDDGLVFAWDVLEGECLHRFRHSERRQVNKMDPGTQKTKKDFVSAVAFCKSRREWASAGGDGSVVVWGMPR